MGNTKGLDDLFTRVDAIKSIAVVPRVWGVIFWNGF